LGRERSPRRWLGGNLEVLEPWKIPLGAGADLWGHWSRCGRAELGPGLPSILEVWSGF